MNRLQAAYAWLNGHVNLENRLADVAYGPDAFGLEGFRRRLAALGDPQRGLTTIHIAGTRGKGSAALMLEALIEASGLRTAVYTSPHLREYRERVRIDGKMIDAEIFCRLLDRVAAVPSDPDEPPHPTGFKTVFENLTALFFLAARESGVDWTIVETGLGGRLDATNAIEPGPVLLTRIGLEHTRLLGDTREKIAAEKAAILKAGGMAVAGGQEAPAAGDAGAIPVFQRRARETGAPLAWARELCPIREVRAHAAGQSIELEFEGEAMTLDLGLYGAFVAENLQNALAMLAVLRGEGRLPPAPRSALKRALERLRLPGRLERVSQVPELYADGAHCPTGAAALAASMWAHFGEAPADLIVGMLSDKDYVWFLATLAHWPGWRRVAVYKPNDPRGLAAEQLAEEARRWFDGVRVCNNLQDALRFIAEGAEKHTRAVATGTLYSVAALQDWGEKRATGHVGATQAAEASEPGADSRDS